MSSGKALIFIVLSSAIMMSAVLLQNVMGPKKVVDEAVLENIDPAPDAPGALDENGPADALPNSPDETSKIQDAPSDDPSSQEDPSATEGAPESKPQPQVEPKLELDESDAPQTLPDDEIPKDEISKDDFITIGSLKPDGSDRFLITLNRKGGTIHRVELNYRNEKGKYGYQDAVWKGGYLGSLDCINTDFGVQVQVVGDGTPAQLAGIE